MVVLHDNLPPDADESQKRFAKAYWQGSEAEWSDLRHSVSSGKDIILFPYRSNLVILDCDIKVVPEFGDNGKTAGFRTEKGIEQLSKAVADLGHTMAEVATYTVRTKSGGLHLYYQQNDGMPLRKTSHHREGWRVDVIVSENLWIAAPPTPGYEVVREIPARVMPEWLSEWLGSVNERFRPCGGKKAERLIARSGMQATVKAPGGGNLLVDWVNAEIDLIRLSNDHGGWNMAIFQAACNLLEYNLSYESVRDWLLAAAAPWNDQERRNAERTIESARQTVTP